MGRWQPDAEGRLQRAALELIADRGYDRITVTEIAASAGLTERTFFRYFADKREVLFAGQDQFIALVVDALVAAPPDLAPLEAIVTAFGATTAWFDERRALARSRQGAIDAHPDLQERELAKIAKLSAAMAQALRDRGASEPQAALAAAAGVAAFRFGFAQWLADADEHDLESHILSAVEDLRKVTAV
ncbi:TetR/AcrR family transcriptional regulator [Saccharopolyspora antimicrobica]|uniref:TetR family transcriptional regulator n=1 Tax=Saccharopolyspora antimicrobica TaxID=455193 RepID=A0ABX9T6C0_9PSEU|nr:TetR family transcriptional regulator [Saccharopolyspora antimicrobica]RKT82547.1 TetR family transcriptional regulator [Saccharopolyspora antimicrobica]